MQKKELVILLKAELVPTLQERITQRVRTEELYRRWKKEAEDTAARVRGQQ